MWWGDVGMKFLTRAPFDVRWLREKRLDDPYGGFLYETTVEDKVLIMFEHKYNQEKYDQPGADFSSCSYEFSIPIIRFYGLVYGAEPCVYAMRMLSI